MTRPFLKWPGGKYNLLAAIKNALPPGKRLVEPFVGSGAVFLNTDYRRYLLADANADLIAVYQRLQRQGETFIQACEKYFSAKNNREAQFYELRDKFNQCEYAEDKAPLFIYLNRHGYNGLCRYNASGEFNVPFGKYAAPRLPQARMLDFHEKAKRARFLHADFLTTLKQARAGDVVYCDPPYVPLSNTSHFTAYHSLCFAEARQIQLAECARKLAARGIPVIISNHDTDFTREIYQGAEITSFQARRSISCNGRQRNPVKELLAVFHALTG